MALLVLTLAGGVACGGRAKPKSAKVRVIPVSLAADAYAHYFRARIASLEGDLSLAVSELKAAQAAAPGESSIAIALARALYEKGDTEEALLQVQRATERWPKSFAVWVAAGDLQRGLANHERAEAHYKRAIRRGARSESVHLAYAEELRWQGKTKSEEAQYRKLLAKTDGSAEVHYRLALLLYKLGKATPATKHAQKASALSPYDLRIWALLGTSLAKEGREKESLESLRAPFDRSGGNAFVANGLLSELLDLNNQKAALALVSVLDRDDLPVDTRISMGHMHLRLAKFEAALATAARLDKTLATSSAIAELRARGLRALGRDDEAKKQLRAISSTQKGHALVRALLAELLADGGDFAAAQEVASSALTQHPDNADLVLARASVAEKSGDREGARQQLRAAIARHPNAQRPRFALAELEKRDGKVEEAVSLISPLIQKNPRDVEALNYVGYSLIDKVDQRSRARALLLRALELAPDSAFILDSYGWLLFKSGQYRDAAPFLERAARLSQTEPELIWHLAELRWQQKQPSEALRLLARAETLALDRHLRGKIQRRRHMLRTKP